MENFKTFANKMVLMLLIQLCIVTGGSSGIGKALIKELKIEKQKK